MKIEYPENVHLIRGNHEAADINALFGFRLECIERMVMWFFINSSPNLSIQYHFGCSIEVRHSSTLYEVNFPVSNLRILQLTVW